MANYETDPVTGIRIPTVGVDPGTDYAVNVSAALETLAHLRHTGVGNTDGYQIPAAGLNIDDDVSMQSNNLTDITSTRFTDQVATLIGAGDIDCCYTVNGDLYFNNGAGASIKITAGGLVNVVASNAFPLVIKTANFTIDSLDTDAIYSIVPSAALVATLPLAADVTAGKIYYFSDASGTANVNIITVQAAGGDTIDGGTAHLINHQYGSLFVISDGVSKWLAFHSGQVTYNSGESLVIEAGADLFNDGTFTGSSGSSTTIASGGNFTVASGANSTIHSSTIDTSNITISTGKTLTVASGSTLTIAAGATTTATLGTGDTITIDGYATTSIDIGAGNIDIGDGGSLNANLNSNIIVLTGGQMSFETGSYLFTDAGTSVQLGGFMTYSPSKSSTRIVGMTNHINSTAAVTPAVASFMGYYSAGAGAPYMVNGQMIFNNVDLTTLAFGVEWCLDSYLIDGAVLATVNWSVQGAAGHAGLPTLPQMCVYRKGWSAASPGHLSGSTFLTSSYANTTAYQTQNTSTYTTTQNSVVDKENYSYYCQFWNECGANGVTGFKIYGMMVTMTNINDTRFQ